MNEPHDIVGGSRAWEDLAQRAVTAIRGAGANNWIWVAGDEWGSAAAYNERHPKWFITDPLNRCGPEGHYCFDASKSRIGNYPNSYEQDEAAARGQTYANYTSLQDKVLRELGGFANYCKKFDLHGLIGEIGWPGQWSWDQPPRGRRQVGRARRGCLQAAR